MTFIRACRLPARAGRPVLVPGGLACAAAARGFPLSPAPIRLPSAFGFPLTTALSPAPTLLIEPPSASAL